MPEIRQDPFSRKMVIISKDRAKRPINLKDSEENMQTINGNKCFFCTGNEELTPPEVDRIEKNGVWQTRIIPNKFPILSNEASIDSEEKIYTSSCGYGVHDVVIETNRHEGNFFNMTEEEFYNYIFILKKRYNSLKVNTQIEYISIFKNHQRKAGASLEHAHSQILTVPVVPIDIFNEVESARAQYGKTGRSLHDTIISYERQKNERIIHESEDFIILAPYASLYNNEIEVICKDNVRFEDISEKETNELSSLLKNLFSKMYRYLGDFPFNMYIHTHPVNEKFIDTYKWHIHIAPRMSCQAGFELSTGIYVNAITPESVAELLKW